MLLKAERGLLDGSSADTLMVERLAKARHQSVSHAMKQRRPLSKQPVSRLAVPGTQNAQRAINRFASPAPKTDENSLAVDIDQHVSMGSPLVDGSTIGTPTLRSARAQPHPRAISPPQLVLPSGWACAVSRSCGKIFYYNRDTGERQWAVPRFDGARKDRPRAIASSPLKPDQTDRYSICAQDREASHGRLSPQPFYDPMTTSVGGATASPRQLPSTPKSATFEARPGHPEQQFDRQSGKSPVPNPPSLQHAPLPPGWRVATSKSKRLPFYYNPLTGQKQWKHPSTTSPITS